MELSFFFNCGAKGQKLKGLRGFVMCFKTFVKKLISKPPVGALVALTGALVVLRAVFAEGACTGAVVVVVDCAGAAVALEGVGGCT
jgi:hypothetical protein